MPFEMTISRLEARADEITVTGRVTSGAYAGPEWVTLLTTDDRKLTTIVTHHSMSGASEWPITPSDGGTLTLHIRAPRQPLTFDRAAPLTGIGFRQSIDSRVDITPELDDPRFWAMHIGLMLESDDDSEATAGDYFGIEADAINEFYDSVLESAWNLGAWPFARLPVGSDAWVEVEFAADVEFQTRFRIGTESGARIQLGYDSGHFSLPALRWAEIAAIAKAGGERAAMLMLPGCREGSIAAFDEKAAREMITRLPGFDASLASTAARSITAHCAIEDLRWSRDQALGWINDSTYSQRNPKGLMTTLEPMDFEAVRRFFAAIDAE